MFSLFTWEVIVILLPELRSSLRCDILIIYRKKFCGRIWL